MHDNPHLGRPLAELEISAATVNALATAGITTVRELVQRTQADLLKTKQIGRKSLREVMSALEDLGLVLGTKL